MRSAPKEPLQYQPNYEDSLQDILKSFGVTKEGKHMHYSKQKLESKIVKVIWKIVKKETDKQSTEEETLSVYIKDNNKKT